MTAAVPRILGLVVARSGSKRLPGKNSRMLFNKPLMAWTFEEAGKSRYIDKLIISTDDPSFIEIAQQYGCDAPFVRPKHLAEDHTPGIDPVLHALEMMPDYDIVVLLQPTSPLRQAHHIDACVELLIKNDVDAVISVSAVTKSPYWMYTMNRIGYLSPFLDKTSEHLIRQELDPIYIPNGAVYVAQVSKLKQAQSFIGSNTLGFIMSEQDSIDIDTEVDFLIAEHFLKLRSVCKT